MARNKFWNTGVNSQGTQLKANAVDPHWKLIQGPGITGPQDVFVLADQRIGTYFMTSDSRWVWANPAGNGDPSSPYVFQTKFFLEVDLSHNWFQISGRWGVDNNAYFTIDLAPLPLGSGGGEVSLPSGNVVTNYKAPHDFSIPRLISDRHRSCGSASAGIPSKCGCPTRAWKPLAIRPDST